MTFHTLRAAEHGTPFSQEAIASFLHTHLGQYGDRTEDISKAIDYAWQRNGGRGGLVVLAEEAGQLAGAVVINETGMDGYIPENILVYIAIHSDRRGEGLGSRLLQEAIGQCRGSVALHVEPDNPAKRLYERFGFTNKYLEMRLSR
jgi:GNAT superfamily N-acetyltransferase